MVTDKNYKSDSQSYYDKRFGDEFKDDFNSEETQRWHHISSALASISKGTEQEITILDFGCGNGRFAHRLSAFGNVTGVDLSEKAIAAASENFPTVRFLAMDASSKTDIQDQIGSTFDVVVSTEVIEHVLNQQEYVNNIASLIKPGGHLIMTTPNGQWKDHYFYGKRSKWGQPYEFWLTAEALKDMLAQAGLTVLDNFTFNTDWVLKLDSFGQPEHHRTGLIPRIVRKLTNETKYMEDLRSKGFGLYLFTLAHK